MGWFWGSSKDNASQTPSQPTPATAATTSQPPPTKTMTSDEQADAEFSQFLSSIQQAESKTSATPSSSSTTTSTQQYPTPSQKRPTPQSPISPEALVPDEMTCSTAFDYAFFCQSLGGQWVNVYRYGSLRSCSEHWSNFWTCMKARSMPDGTRRGMIRDHNREKLDKYKNAPSSDDVWGMRLVPVKNAFSGDFAQLEKEMAEAEKGADF